MTEPSVHETKSSLHYPWSLTRETLFQELQTNEGQGLSSDEVEDRLKDFGPNLLRQHKKRNVVSILVNQFKSIIIALLVAAALVAFWLGEFIDGWAILVVILINTLIGFFTELRAVRSMEALFSLGKVKTRVRRDGNVKEVDAEELVPGDIAIVEGGDVITADLRIIAASKLQADESALTGESLPIEKKTEAVGDDTVLAERSSMLYKGTSVTRGSGEGVVVATGLETELGHISSLVEEAEDEQTPLEKRLDSLGYRLIGVTLLIAVFVIASGIFAGKNLYLMIETGIALAVAAIPEGLPIVATIALAKGIRIMAQKNALINRLSSVETLGATGIICTDKTGTLTENKMTVTQLFLSSDTSKFTIINTDNSLNPREHSDLQLALEVSVLCNNASLSRENGNTGDPLEVALLEVADKAGIDLSELNGRYPEIREEAFDPEVKMMATWNELPNQKVKVYVKGAPGAVLRASTSEIVNAKMQPLTEERRQQWVTLNRELATEGLRIIALAVKNVDSSDGEPYRDLTFVGLAALSDPPRADVRPAIERCYQAGIHVVMITGDQVDTARYIADSIGLRQDGVTVMHGNELPDSEGLTTDPLWEQKVLNTSVFARINPHQKLNLIEFFQKKGHIVAMTGDGINDAPALKKSDIGIAMGQRGTQVAREAADMVLTDDAFPTIVAAIEQGRIIFGNIRRFIYYLMSCNVSEVFVVGLASMLGTPLPILPLQILFLNLVTDVFPALALGVGEGEPGVMRQLPRKSNQPILDAPQWKGIALYGLMITISVLIALYLALHFLNLSARDAVTISFLTLAFSQLWHVFNMRSTDSSFINNTITRNPYIWGALALCIGLLLVAVYLPALATVLQVTPPNFLGWVIIIVMSLIPFLVGQLKIVISFGE